MNKKQVEVWLRERDPVKLQELWNRADAVRRKYVGEAVHLRGLLEISNYCARQCAYCGLFAGNTSIPRYRMTIDEILTGAKRAMECGFGTVVMQSGEDYGMDKAFITEVICRIKTETPLAVTLSLGERKDDELLEWRNAGADRYLLRFETSDAALFDAIHPPLGRRRVDRIAFLKKLQSMGYETGSGVMIGIPGQTYATLANDILLFQSLDLDMIGMGPYIPHPGTRLGSTPPAACEDQVAADETTVCNALALTRILCPDTNIPATTALATIDKAHGYEEGLARGANVIMPNVTPKQYRALYQIYPSKVCIDETPEYTAKLVQERIIAAHRTIGKGPGGRFDAHTETEE